jgi:hypothetical protein
LELEKLPQWRSIFSSLEYVVNVCGTHQLWNKYHISGYVSDLEKNATIRRRGAHIANVVPGPRPRTGFGGGDVKYCLLLWWNAVGKDQATKLHVWRLIFHCRCIGNGKIRRLVCPPSCRN